MGKKPRSIDVIKIKDAIQAQEALAYQSAGKAVEADELLRAANEQLRAVTADFNDAVARRQALCDLIGWDSDPESFRLRVLAKFTDSEDK